VEGGEGESAQGEGMVESGAEGGEGECRRKGGGRSSTRVLKQGIDHYQGRPPKNYPEGFRRGGKPSFPGGGFIVKGEGRRFSKQGREKGGLLGLGGE